MVEPIDAFQRVELEDVNDPPRAPRSNAAATGALEP